MSEHEPGMPSDAHEHVSRQARELLGGDERYTVRQAAELSGLTVGQVVRFWHYMGFPTIRDTEDSIVFTDADIEAMQQHAGMMTSGLINEHSLESLTRAQSHMSDRLVLWQHEALVDYARSAMRLDAVSARFWVLDHITEYEAFVRHLMDYSWRRHMVALLRRSETEVTEMSQSASTGVTLDRAFGFIDMVAFTNRSNEIGSAEFIHLIEEFDSICRSTIHTNGARVVKTIGDAFLYICDDVMTGAHVVSEVVEQLRAAEGMLPVRASLVWGSVVSRFGDIFGPKVNLASRLVDVAEPGTILVDSGTADVIRANGNRRYTLVPAGAPNLQGFGAINAVELRRMPVG